MKSIKLKIIGLLICSLFLTSMFSVNITAKNHISIETRTIDSNVDLKGDLIKITDKDSICDLDKDFVVYTYGASMIYDHLYIYNITTGETDELFLGGDMNYPKIHEHRVVFLDSIYNGFKMYNIDTSETTNLIVTNWITAEADDFHFYGDYIVYEYTDSDLYSTEIFLYNIATSKNIQLTDTPGEDYPENPCIYENIVAWQLNEGNIADIVMYNIDTEKYTRITNTSEFESETFPSIYENNIVYSYLYYDKLNGTILYGLKMYNINSEDETTLFTKEEPTGSTPEIFGNKIAYSEPGVSLRLLDLTTNINTTIYEGDMLAYPWNLNGNYTAFTLVKDGIYLYNYTTTQGFEIQDITGGLFKVRAAIKNTGDAEATNVQWSIKLTGGIIILGKETTDTISSIAAGETSHVSSKLILGFGKTVITVSAETATRSQNATVLLVFIKIQ